MGSEFLFHTVSSLVRRLPLPAAYAVADVTAAVAPLIARRRAAAARTNFEAVAPFAGRPAEALVRDAFRSHHRLTVEFLRACALPDRQVEQAVGIRGLDRLRDALRGGRGAILVTAHVGNWEVLALAGRGAGVVLHTVAGVQFHPLVSAAAHQVKERANVRVHGPEAAPLLRALRAGHSVVLHLDGGFIGRGAEVTLFGRRAWIARGPLVLAARSGAPILPLSVRRTGPFRFEAEIGDPWPAIGAGRDGADRLAREIERQVLAAPEQWALFRDLFRPRDRAAGTSARSRDRGGDGAPGILPSPLGAARPSSAAGRLARARARGSLRIALVTQSYYPAFGGVSEHVHHLAGALEERGHAVTIVTARFAGTADGTGAARRVVRIGRGVSVPFHGGRSHLVVGWGLGRKLGRVLGEGRFDIVHAHSPLVPTLPLLALRTRGARAVGTFHTAGDPARYEMAGPPLRRLLRSLDAGIAVSEPARQFAARFYGGPLTVIPNGIDLERFHPNGAAPRPGPRIVLCVGRLENRKGHSVLLDAFARLESGRPGRAVLVVAGDGPLAARLRGQAARLPPAAVRFAGAVSPEMLPGIYRSADLFVAPALRNESFGIVLLEAMASGLPVIASDIPGYRGVLGEDACFVKAGDPADLVRALDALLEDPARRQDLARAGRARAARFGWIEVAERVESLYREALGRSAG